MLILTNKLKPDSPYNSSMLLIGIIITLAINIRVTNCNKVHRVYLSQQWQVTTSGCSPPQRQAQFQNLQMYTTIPTVIHLDLLKNQKIPDPFFGDNYLKAQWISGCNVTYSRSFMVQKDMTNVELVFQGIDTYGVVKVNLRPRAFTNNSFVQYRILLTKEQLYFDKQNLLQVEISSTKRYDGLANSKNRMPFQYAHSRKAAYQYSWDWAPYLNTMGIWKPVYLQYYENIALDYVWVRNREITKSFAILNFAIALKIPDQVDMKTIKKGFLVLVVHNGTQIANINVDGKYVYSDVRINQPKLWWPNGIGEQNLYEFQVSVVSIDGKNIDTKKVVFGIKTVKLDQTNNKFTVQVNGHPIYCKGANYVPPDMFYPRLNNPDYQPGNTYIQLLKDAVQSHFNMIRLWGGGQYESDQFYELASRKGIMIFYDFMFSDSIYPSTTQFLKNVEHQITQQIRRVRNYPCLTLWSGNNQILQGIQSWGWGRDNYRNDYKRLFEETIPAVLQKENPDIPYIPSSPVNGVGNGGFERGGDVHYWGVWAAGALFESYKTAIGPFNSQFGTQAIPVWQTVKNFTQQSQRGYQSSQFSTHERHNSRFNTHNRYIQTYGHKSKDFEHQTYLSGLVQAFGIEIAIKHQRISKPKSYGTLYWQFNDAWPAISWSSIDYFGRWKPLQYMAKRSYPDVAIFCADGKIIAVNDNLYTVQGIAITKIQHFNGTVLINRAVPIILTANQVKTIQELKKTEYQDLQNQIVVYSEIISGRQKQMSSTYFYVPFKQLKLDPSAMLYVKLLPQHNTLKLRTNKFIKNLYISSSRQYIKLSDNYFDLIANKQYKIKLDDKHKLQQIKNTLIFRSYIQIHSESKLEVVYE